MGNLSIDLRSIKLAINGRFLSQRITGVQRSAFEVVCAIDDLLAAGVLGDAEVTLLLPSNVTRVPSFRAVHTRIVGRWTGHLWEQLELPFYEKGALGLNLAGTAPILPHRQIDCFYDASVFATPHAYSFVFRSWYQVMYRIQCSRAMSILTSSEFSRLELERHCRCEIPRDAVVRLAADHMSGLHEDESVLKRFRLVPNRYVLLVSSMNPNKNFAAAVKAATRLDSGVQIVVAGGNFTTVFQNVDLASERIVRVGYVSDEQLKALYTRAACFVFPSLYEGFGFPALEAMSVGCPVVASQAASIPEVCGDAALYCDPHSIPDIEEKLRTVLEDRSVANHLRVAGPKRASMFSWKKTAMMIWEHVVKVHSYIERLAT